ncbi:hypothetical protein YPPY08_3862, partial [Yersinia pestis PY-08]
MPTRTGDINPFIAPFGSREAIDRFTIGWPSPATNWTTIAGWVTDRT